MMRVAPALLALTLGAWLLMSTSPSLAQEQGTISGAVVNGTAGGGPTAGLTVTLTVFESTPVERQTVTDEAGAFVFEQVPLSPEATYQLSTVYADVQYAGEPGSLASAEGLSDQRLAVYETTSDPAVVRASMVHVVIEPNEAEEHSLLVTEIVVVNNSSDRAYVGPLAEPAGTGADDAQERPETVRFAVPPDASEVAIIDGLLVEDLVTTDSGFTDTTPWVPGERQVAFSYSLPYEGSDYTFDTSLDFPADTVTILMPKDMASLKSGSPFTQDETVLQGETYLRARAEKLEAGAAIQANLTGLPRSGEGSNAQTRLLAALAVAAVGVVTLLGFNLYRSAKGGRLAAVSVADAGEREKANLLLAIVELDRQHEAGGIAEPEYRRRRTEAKQRLEAIW